MILPFSNGFRSALIWLGFMQAGGTGYSHGNSHDHDHAHGGPGSHGHTHGVVDPTIATSARGIWAIKWSFVILAITAALQLVVVLASSSVALLADTIHNVGDAATAVPLWIAFALALRKPSPRFTYGLGRVEDLAGVVVILIILFSAIVAGYVAVDRFIHPQQIHYLPWVAIAGVIGFIGNETVAVFRIRVGREIDSAALIADGYHARTDGLTSLAVVVGAAGVWLGFPLADPIIGAVITVAIFGIVWQSANAIFTRMLDGVEPDIIAEIRHAAEHVPGIRRVLDARARWLGHRLHAELDVAVDGAATVAESDALIASFERQLVEHVPALAAARIRVRPHDPAAWVDQPPTEKYSHEGGHHHGPKPVAIQGNLAAGVLEIVETPEGERMRFTPDRLAAGVEVVVVIDRPGGVVETLPLKPEIGSPSCRISMQAPAEPHEFTARLQIRAVGGSIENLPFRMAEPIDHLH